MGKAPAAWFGGSSAGEELRLNLDLRWYVLCCGANGERTTNIQVPTTMSCNAMGPCAMHDAEGVGPARGLARRDTSCSVCARCVIEPCAMRPTSGALFLGVVVFLHCQAAKLPLLHSFIFVLAVSSPCATES